MYLLFVYVCILCMAMALIGVWPTASPSGQNFACLVRSRLQCHVRRHRHARNKGKFGSYAFLHATPSDYIRSHCTSYFTWSFFFLWIFRDVSKHQSCGMKCYNFLTFDVLNKMNLLLSKLFSFTFMWEPKCSLNYVWFPYLSHDSAALCYTGVGTVQNTQNFAPTVKRCMLLCMFTNK